ncbi:MAG: GNAT family N-acetyltransferase [Tepidisphaeraceae bacterium]
MRLIDLLPLTTDRLTLRAPTVADLDACAAMHADPEVMRYLTPRDRDATAFYLGQIAATLDAGKPHFLTVTETATSAFVGLAGLFEMGDRFRVPLGEPAPLVEVAYRLARPHWNKGYASEAGRVLLDIGFDQLGLERIGGIADVRNEASNRVLAKIGLKFQRTFTTPERTLHFYALCAGERRITAMA